MSITNEKNLIQALANDFDSEKVIFGGEIEAKNSENGKAYFWTYTPVGKDLMGLPSSTANEAVIAQLKEMKVGTIFNLSSYKSSGPLGIEIDAIEVDNPPSIIRLSEDTPEEELPHSISINSLPCMQ